MRDDTTRRTPFENPLGLPGVTGVEISRVRFDPPKRFYSEGRLIEQVEAVQLLVRTTGPLPVRDLTPVIFIGDVQVAEYERVGLHLYRFLAYDVEQLPLGAPISLGWPSALAARIPTNFGFNLGPPLVS